MIRRAGVLMLAMMISGCSGSQRLTDFRATLAAQQSATVALEQWCAKAGIATPARIEAITLDNADSGDGKTTPAIRAALGVDSAEPVKVRHVRLECGGVVLSDARNWLVPARLTPAMNQTLATTHTPFGKVVASLIPMRQPLPPGMPSPAPCPPRTITHVTAILHRNDGQPISLVSECYTRANIGQ